MKKPDPLMVLDQAFEDWKKEVEEMLTPSLSILSGGNDKKEELVLSITKSALGFGFHSALEMVNGVLEHVHQTDSDAADPATPSNP